MRPRIFLVFFVADSICFFVSFSCQGAGRRAERHLLRENALGSLRIITSYRRFRGGFAQNGSDGAAKSSGYEGCSDDSGVHRWESFDCWLIYSQKTTRSQWTGAFSRGLHGRELRRFGFAGWKSWMGLVLEMLGMDEFAVASDVLFLWCLFSEALWRCNTDSLFVGGCGVLRWKASSIYIQGAWVPIRAVEGQVLWSMAKSQMAYIIKRCFCVSTKFGKAYSTMIIVYKVQYMAQKLLMSRLLVGKCWSTDQKLLP